VLGPFVPIDVLVPAELADRAHELVGAALAGDDTAAGGAPVRPD
jgi:hypothetical protein